MNSSLLAPCLRMALVVSASGALLAGTPAPAPPAQERDVLMEALAPEISLRYDYDFPMMLDGWAGEYSMHEYRVSAPIPPVLTDSFIMLMSVNYRLFQADIRTDVLHGIFDLHTLRLPVQAAWLSPSSPWMAIVYAEPGLSTDFNVINSDSFDLSAAGGAGYRFSPNFFLGLGAVYSRNYGQDDVFPGIALLWRVSDQFTLNISPDGVVPQWQPHEDWKVKLKFDFLGGRWTIEDAEERERQVRLEGASLNLLLERRISGQCWITLGAGFNTLANLRIEDGEGGELLDRDLEEGLLLRSGLKWTF